MLKIKTKGQEQDHFSTSSSHYSSHLPGAASPKGRLAPGPAVGRGRAAPSVDGAAAAKGAAGAGVAVGSAARAVVGNERTGRAGAVLGLAPAAAVRARRAAPSGRRAALAVSAESVRKGGRTLPKVDPWQVKFSVPPQDPSLLTVVGDAPVLVVAIERVSVCTRGAFQT